MIKLSLQQAEVLQNFISEMLEMHDEPTQDEEYVFTVLDAAIDAEKDKKVVAN